MGDCILDKRKCPIYLRSDASVERVAADVPGVHRVQVGTENEGRPGSADLGDGVGSTRCHLLQPGVGAAFGQPVPGERGNLVLAMPFTRDQRRVYRWNTDQLAEDVENRLTAEWIITRHVREGFYPE